MHVTLVEAGRTAIPFELNLDPSKQNILSDEGFVNALYNTMRVRIAGGFLHAPVCSTWVFMILWLVWQKVSSKMVHTLVLITNLFLLRMTAKGVDFHALRFQFFASLLVVVVIVVV